MTEVYENPPFGTHILEFGPIPRGYHEGDLWYKCKHCNGWIKGSPGERRENSLGPLCGRQGVTYYCIHCNQDICFVGKIA
jgi:hypothetical protein